MLSTLKINIRLVISKSFRIIPQMARLGYYHFIMVTYWLQSFVKWGKATSICCIPVSVSYTHLSYYKGDSDKKSKLQEVKRIADVQHASQIKEWQMEDDDELYELLEEGW